MNNKSNYDTIPVGQLGIIALPGCEELAAKIDHYLKTWRYERNSEHKDTLAFAGYENTMDLYETAVENSYRFFSFGDAMFIE